MSTTAALPAVWSLVLTVAVLGPFLVSPGYLLFRDAVSTPRSFLTDSALGLSDAAARAVPQDALLAWVSTVVDGGVAVTALLVASLWAAGWGAARLVAVVLPTSGTGARLVAATVAIWNPYVAERLLQGHWSLLAGYAALPWTAETPPYPDYRLYTSEYPLYRHNKKALDQAAIIFVSKRYLYNITIY